MAEIKKYETIQPIDGVSFMPLLTNTGDPSKGRSLYWNFPNLWGNTGPGIGATCTIRQGRHKRLLSLPVLCRYISDRNAYPYLSGHEWHNATCKGRTADRIVAPYPVLW